MQWSQPRSGGVTYPSVQTFNAKIDRRAVSLQQHGPAHERSACVSTATTSARPAASGCRALTARRSRSTRTATRSGSAPPTRRRSTRGRRPVQHRRTTTPTRRRRLERSTTGRTRTSRSASSATARAARAATTTTASAARSAASNIGLLDVPADLQHASGYADNQSNTFTVKDDYSRFNISGDLTRFANWKGQHAFKIGMQFERLGNDVNKGQQFPNVAIIWNASRTTLGNRSVRGTYGYYIGRAAVHDRQHPLEQHRAVPAGSVDVQPEADDQLRRALRLHEHPVVPRGEPGHQVRLGRQDRAAPRLRLRPQGRRQVEDLRLVGHLLRHREARDAARRVRRRALDAATTGRSTTTTGRRSTATARRPAAARAPTSSRTTCGTCRTTRATTWSIRT